MPRSNAATACCASSSAPIRIAEVRALRTLAR
jgi:hypothetical protein